MASRLIKENKKNMMTLAEQLPEKASLEALEHFTDIALYDGVKDLHKIIKQPNEEKVISDDGGVVIKLIEAKTKIKAFDSLVGLGRYIEVRKVNEANDTKIEFVIDDPDLVLNK